MYFRTMPVLRRSKLDGWPSWPEAAVLIRTICFCRKTKEQCANIADFEEIKSEYLDPERSQTVINAYPTKIQTGWMAEWSKAAVLKTVVG